jgi:hypothetical protein
VSDDIRPDGEVEAAAERSERILEDTYLSGAQGMGAAGPRLSASTLHGPPEDGTELVHEDHSWKSHAVEEGDEEAAETATGTWGRLRRWLRGN